MPASDPLVGLIRDVTSGGGRAVSAAPQTYGNVTTDDSLARFGGNVSGPANGTPKQDTVSYFPPLPLTLLSLAPDYPGGTIDVLSVVQVAGPPGDGQPLGLVTHGTIGRIIYE